ncbi:unnamed protein product [Hydatigera taeniaeformis]|uniref:FHA domain-containing protein n=1 Tax=Hydatigena taeniaeformis TaxID=6205 RepID=A0A0R3X406_HYDTA|nr:unnamed protein product [Hydatigera taeniaeformis]
MTTVSLLWVGDLNQDKRMASTSMKVSDERYRPKLIELKEGQKEIRIGRLNSTNPPHYLIESCINKRMISRNHATIERLPDGGFMLYDHSMNGTYVNYMRVSGGVTLKNGDIVCFGHLNGANLKPGDDVTPFFSDLKYQVYIGSPKEVAAATAAAGDSNSDRISVNKRQRKSSGGSHEVKKGVVSSSKTPSRHRGGDEATGSIKSEAEDSDEDLMDRLSKRKSGVQSGGNSVKRNPSCKSNGMKKHASPPPSVVKRSKHHSKKSRAREVAVDAEDDENDDGDGDSAMGGDNEDVARYGEDDQEECSARTCKKPAGTAIDWIQCDKCSKWYHQICLNLTPEEANVDVYYCPSCTKKR